MLNCTGESVQERRSRGYNRFRHDYDNYVYCDIYGEEFHSLRKVLCWSEYWNFPEPGSRPYPKTWTQNEEFIYEYWVYPYDCNSFLKKRMLIRQSFDRDLDLWEIGKIISQNEVGPDISDFF